ncbi:uncharacterized protein LOC127257586 isoform X2 [Andrographis paniculata]|uniref:uncharacterized protein LOC127257586 isoform X2 n=1 Tax=Andrographis paniculata TaxID=175694 RepID=UPI0021E93765|nr:uncharacterized protein LOC127257586 isoform X2 [Andrographis paniculata]
MERSGENGEARRKISIEFGMAGDKFNLIDILSEDDEFLSASPFAVDSFKGFRLSGIGSHQELEPNDQKEENLLPVEFTKPSRPSFLRKSLAWDSAFFDNAGMSDQLLDSDILTTSYLLVIFLSSANAIGVLDPDELSYINKGFKKAPDAREQRSESITATGSNKSCRATNPQHRLHRAQSCKNNNGSSFRKLGRSSSSMVKSDQATPAAKSVNVHNKEKMKETTPARSSATGSNIGSLSAKSSVRKGSPSAAATAGLGLSDNTNIADSSRLRLPSPRLRFFDENTPSRSSTASERIPFDQSRTLKQSRTVGSSSFLTAEKEILSKSKSIVDQRCRNSTNQLSIVNSCPKESAAKRDAPRGRIGNLSQQLIEPVDLKKREKVEEIKKGKTYRASPLFKQLKKLCPSLDSSRMPLADKTGKYDLNGTKSTSYGSKKDKLGKLQAIMNL